MAADGRRRPRCGRLRTESHMKMLSMVGAAFALALGCTDAGTKTPVAEVAAADLKPMLQADGTAVLAFTFVDKKP